MKLCIIMRNIYCICFLCNILTVFSLIWFKRKKGGKNLNVKQIFLIEFVEVPLEFNIIFLIRKVYFIVKNCFSVSGVEIRGQSLRRIDMA